MDYSRIKDNQSLIRDLNSNSIINTNSLEYEDYLHRKKINLEKSEKMNEMETEIQNIKNDLGEIKNLLRSILNESR